MKSLRDRMQKSMPNLAISTRKSYHQSRKCIQTCSEGEFARIYKLGGQVMESTHTGMEVLYATRCHDGLQVVVKVRQKSCSFKSGTEEFDWRNTTEVQLNMPKTENICEYMEVFETKDNYYVVMEKVGGKDLFEKMAEEHIGQVDAREIVRQILEALNNMHVNGRIHKDLKLENVMVDLETPAKRGGIHSRVTTPISNSGCASSPLSTKLIDFDTVENWEPTSPKAKDVLGTDGYIAPEAYDGEYSPASDIYCVGVIMYKLLTRKFPSPADIFDDKPGENYVGSPAMRRIRERLRIEQIDFQRAPLDKCPPAADLCRKMLAFEAQDRPSAEDALMHEWFKMRPEDFPPTPRKPSSRRLMAMKPN